ncbi:MAG TPA: efflux RND transporter periplasmic adaptor subunit, partial [Myxococcales bacterium]|nr:efflux RND transporter periplasmic adaptor subunit [Myxococcales bacterium]
MTGAAAWWLAGPARAAKGPPRGPAPVAVVVERVLQRDFPEVATGIGRVQPLQSAVVRPQIDGLLAEVHFKEGQPVKEGQLLARLDDRTLAADLAQVRATRASNLAQLETAKLDLVRYTNLLAGEAIARQRVDQQRAQVQQLEAALAASDAAIAAAEARLSFTRITAPLSGRAGLRRVDRGNFVRA